MFLLEEESFESPIFNFGGIDTPAWQILLMILGVLIVIALPIVIVSIVQYKRTGEKFKFTTRDLTYAAICLAMSYVLSFFGFQFPLGGTITPASILPLSIFCYYFGFRKSATVCSVYMLLQLTQHPFIISPWSMLFDYFIPYFALSLVGTIPYNLEKHRNATGAKRFALVSNSGYFIGMTMYIVVRYLSHILSGVLFWEAWGYDPASTGYIIAYNMSYNAFCIIDWAIAIAAALALLSSKTFDKLMVDVSSLARPRRKAAAAGSEQGADGSVTAETDGLANADPGPEDHQ